MTETTLLLTESVSPIGNVLVMAVSILLFFLIAETYVTRDADFKLFRSMLIVGFIAANLNQTYVSCLMNFGTIPTGLTYLIRILYHIMLFADLLLYLRYITIILVLNPKTTRRINALGGIFILIMTILDMAASFSGIGFKIINGEEREGLNVFAITYVLLVCLILRTVIVYRTRMIKQVYHGILFTYALCIMLFVVQGRYNHSSFTTTIFLLPVISLMYLMHSNPYDPATGAVDEATFERTIRDFHNKNTDYMVLSLHLIDYDGQLAFTPEIKYEVYHFFSSIVKKPMLFHLSGSRFALVFKLQDNPNHWNIVEQLEHSFDVLYQRFHMNFKAIIMESNEEISKNNSYVKLIQFAEWGVPMNSYYHITDDDIARFTKEQYILGQLEDIASNLNLDDPRILTYCQPVYNVDTQQYDTAEALMRMKLPDIGLVFPDQFIPLAERHALIHPLSLIILNKTCKRVHELLEEGLYINRVSINFSIPEMRDENFTRDVVRIIEQNQVPYEKIAIEITESRDETDFDIIKNRIDELRAYGIKLYLDDFGTGYSNFDRIMELPFDIIKFDRSLVIESGKDLNSEYMVDTFANMFHKLNYKVLYEGIEDEHDEARCIRMKAQYLQGYKYSKPIPIDHLRDFLSPKSA